MFSNWVLVALCVYLAFGAEAATNNWSRPGLASARAKKLARAPVKNRASSGKARSGRRAAAQFRVYPELAINSTEQYGRQTVRQRISNSEVLADRAIESTSLGNLIKDGPHTALHLNGLAEAVHLAYSYHHGLTLSPDHIYIAILQGLAIHINLDPEKHKKALGLGRLARGQKEKIEVSRDSFIPGSSYNDWEGVLAELQQKVSTRIDLPVSRLLAANFSTSTPLSKSVGTLTVLNALKAYFEYSLSTRCGIPEIVLLGTPRDWITLREKANELLSKFDGLDFWLKELNPILDEFVLTTSNHTRNTKFWSSIYKDAGGSGGDLIRGWITTLFPYIQTETDFIQNHYIRWKKVGGLSGIQYRQIPLGFTDTPFTWSYFGIKLNVSFVGGFLGVEKGSYPNHVTPALSWSILYNLVPLT